MKKITFLTVTLLSLYGAHTVKANFFGDVWDKTTSTASDFLNGGNNRHHSKPAPTPAPAPVTNPNQGQIDGLKADISSLTNEINALQAAGITKGDTYTKLVLQRADKQTELSKLGG